MLLLLVRPFFWGGFHRADSTVVDLLDQHERLGGGGDALGVDTK